MESQVVTTGSFERHYTVQVPDETPEGDVEKLVRKRMRQHIEDPSSLREGVVVEHEEKKGYVSGEQIKSVAKSGTQEGA